MCPHQAACLSACLSVCSSECCCKDAICFATPFCLSFCGLLAPANYQNKIVGNKNVYNCATTGERGVESGERETGRDASSQGGREGMLRGLAAAANTADACLSAASGGSKAASKAVVEERGKGREGGGIGSAVSASLPLAAAFHRLAA